MNEQKNSGMGVPPMNPTAPATPPSGMGVPPMGTPRSSVASPQESEALKKECDTLALTGLNLREIEWAKVQLEISSTAAPSYSARLTLICMLLIALIEGTTGFKVALWAALLFAWLMDGVGSKPNRKPKGKERS